MESGEKGGEAGDDRSRRRGSGRGGAKAKGTVCWGLFLRRCQRTLP